MAQLEIPNATLQTFTWDAQDGNPDYLGVTVVEVLSGAEANFKLGIMPAGDPWLSVDFGSDYTVDRWDLGQYGSIPYMPEGCKFQKSDNGTDWTDVAGASFDNTPIHSGYAVDEYVFSEDTARYWRVIQTVPPASGTQYWRVYDVKIYGEAAAASGGGGLDVAPAGQPLVTG